MDIFDRLEMNEEQQELHDKLTPLQRKFSINIVNGLSKKQAYFKAGGSAKTEKTTITSISQLWTNMYVSEFIKQMRKAASEIQMCTAIDVAAALMKEAGILKDDKGEAIPTPEDSTQPARVSALKTLTGHTGGFDKNTQKTEVTKGYIDKPMSEMYSDDKESSDD